MKPKAILLTILPISIIIAVVGVVIITNPDLGAAHNTGNSLIYGGIGGIILAFIVMVGLKKINH